MKIDLRKLDALKKLDLDEKVLIPEEYYQKANIIKMDDILINGSVYINLEEEIVLDVNIKGTFILPCAITLEEVPYAFKTKIEEIIPENDDKTNFMLELLDILWENIVLEVPIRVVKEGINTQNMKGTGWELETDQVSNPE